MSTVQRPRPLPGAPAPGPGATAASALRSVRRLRSAERRGPVAAGMGRWWHDTTTRSILLVAAAVVVANAPYLLHLFDPNPIGQVSGLGTLTAGLLPGGNNIDPNIGFTAQALGHRAALDWAHGTVPWWNPYEGLGAPLAGEMQSAAFFPLAALNVFSDGQVYFRVVLEMVAGIGTYLLLRRLVRTNWAAVAGGVAFALNGTFAWLFHAPGNPTAFAPWLLLGLEWAHDGALRRRWGGCVLIAVAVAASLYAGFPEVAFIDGLLAGIWFLVRAAALPRRAVARFAANVATGAVLGALVAAPVLVAFLDYLPHADIGGHGGAFARASLSSGTALPALVLPYVFGPIFGFSSYDHTNQLGVFWGNVGGYFSASLCLLALVGTLGRRHRPLRIVLAAWIVLGICRLVGVGWALTLVNLVPGVKTTAFYRYAPASWELAIVVLAVLGLDDVARRHVARPVLAGAGLAMVAVLVLARVGAAPVLHQLLGAPHNNAWTIASLVWGCAVVAAVTGAGMLRGERLPAAVVAAVVVLDVAAMFMTPQFSAPRRATVDTAPVAFLARHLGDERFFTLGPLAPNYGSYFALSSLAVNDVPVPKSFETFVTTHLDTNVDPTIFTGTTSTDPAGPSPAQELAAHLSSYEAVGVKYVLVAPGTILPPTPGVHLRTVFRDAAATIVELPRPAPLFGATGGGCAVSATSVTTATVRCASASTVVYRELYMPGWQVSGGGAAGTHPLHDAPYGPVFQAVRVPAGTSTLRFAFTPPHTAAAVAAFVLGVVGLLAFARPRRRRDQRRADHDWAPPAAAGR